VGHKYFAPLKAAFKKATALGTLTPADALDRDAIKSFLQKSKLIRAETMAALDQSGLRKILGDTRTENVVLRAAGFKIG
jgi:hypothetical protein